MRQLCTVVPAVVVMLLVASLVAAHDCIHDTPKIQRFEHDGMDNVRPQKLKYSKEELASILKARRRGMATEATGNGIRFVFSTADLEDSSRYCTAASGTVTDFSGGTIACSSTAEILTTQKKNDLVNEILPKAAKRLSDALNINNPVSSNVVTPSSACTTHTVPASHKSTGVANADYVLYVSAAPTQGSTLGWAGSCASDQNGRSVFGRANFSPKYLNWTHGTQAMRDSIMETATHEILHAIGFTNSRFVNKTTKTNVRGKPSVSILASPKVLEKSREHFGCSTLDGVELEDEGTSAGSHWERRILYDDVMAPSSSYSLSSITLAAIEDQGHYTADYTKAEYMKFGYKDGCSFITEKCNTVGGGKGKYFCFSKDLTTCTTDHTAIGYCGVSDYTSDLASYFQYFSDPKTGGSSKFMDGCPLIRGYSNRVCAEHQTLTTNDQIFGRFYGNGSKCFNTTGLIQSQYKSSADGHRCLQASCYAGGTRMQIAVAGSWVQCPTDGSAGLVDAPSGFSSQIYCPQASRVCDNNITVGGLTTGGSTTTTPATPSPPGSTPVPGSTPAPGSTPTPGDNMLFSQSTSSGSSATSGTTQGGATTPAPSTTPAPASTSTTPAPTTSGGGGSSNPPGETAAPPTPEPVDLQITSDSGTAGLVTFAAVLVGALSVLVM